MGFFGASYSGPREVSYLFIDGGSLRSSIERFHRDFYSELPMPSVNYQRIGQGFTKVFYYDCPPPRGANESVSAYEMTLTQHEVSMTRLRSLRGWHVFEGVTKRQGKKATQKEVDVLIAVDMLTHTHRRNMHRLAFLSGDQDFRPLLEAIVRDGMFVELLYDPASASKELIHSADARVPLTPFVLFSYLEDNFQREHPMPVVSGVINLLPSAATHIRSGTNVANSPIYLAANGNDFVLAYPDSLNEGRFQNMTHANREFLEFVFEKTHGPIRWAEV